MEQANGVEEISLKNPESDPVTSPKSGHDPTPNPDPKLLSGSGPIGEVQVDINEGRSTPTGSKSRKSVSWSEDLVSSRTMQSDDRGGSNNNNNNPYVAYTPAQSNNSSSSSFNLKGLLYL